MPPKVRRMYEPPAESRVILWHFNAEIVTGNAIALVSLANQAFNFQANQNPAAINDSWLHKVYLKRGTYTLDMLGIKKSNSGILTVTISSANSQPYGNTFDLYAAGDVFNSKLQDTAVNIDKDNFYTLAGSMLSKNASSSGYTCVLNMVSLYKNDGA